MVTTSPNAFAARIHDRMPVVLAKRDWQTWLDPKTPREKLDPLLRAWPAEDMDAWRVTKEMNNSRFQGPECEVPISNEPEQPELFEELFASS